MQLLWVCVGGAFGSGARFLVSGAMLAWLGPAFPFGTLVVNLAGSFLLGMIAHVGATTELLSPTVRLALGTGVMGGFTTYSTFSVDTWSLAQSGSWRLAVANVVVTVVGCLIATGLGFAAARAITS